MNIARAWQRILSLIAPVTMTVLDDSGPVLRAQLKIGALELPGDVPVLQQFGLASLPPAGSDGVAVFVAGDRSNGAVIATGHQATRPKSKQPGETILFNGFGMKIYLSQAGIVIDGGAHPVLVLGDLHVGGSLISGFGGTDAVNLATHHHGGVQAGLSNTLAPTAGS